MRPAARRNHERHWWVQVDPFGGLHPDLLGRGEQSHDEESSMLRSKWVIMLIVGLPAVWGCAEPAGPLDEAETRCPPPIGGFSPTACAVVAAKALDLEGAPLPGVQLRVDSMHLGVFYYQSTTVITDAHGDFELRVSRPFAGSQSPPTFPDTATVRVRAFLSGGAGALAEGDASATITASFAPAGHPVPVTSGELRFPVGN
jgi:hypothetical protein